ncbi:MAG: hypothetical protein R3C15_03670 [Thermoleophilia bacterium]
MVVPDPPAGPETPSAPEEHHPTPVAQPQPTPTLTPQAADQAVATDAVVPASAAGLDIPATLEVVYDAKRKAFRIRVQFRVTTSAFCGRVCVARAAIATRSARAAAGRRGAPAKLLGAAG